MQVNSQQQAVTVQPNEREGGSVPQTSARTPFVLGAALTVAAFSPATSQAKPDSSVLTYDDPAWVVEPLPALLQIAASDSKVGFVSEAQPKRRRKDESP